MTMLTLIGLIVIGVVMALCLVGGLVARDAEAKLGFLGVAAILFIIGAFTFLGNSAKIVGANEVGVKVTFGSVDQTPLTSGFHWVAPWTDVETLPTRPKSFTTVAQVRSAENGTIATRITARWATDKANAADLYLQVRSGDEKEIESALINPNVQGAAGEALGSKGNLDLISGTTRSANATAVENAARKYLAKYGVTIDTVRITQVDPDDVTDASIKRQSAQVIETDIAERAKATATKQAERNLIEAKGIKAAAAELANLTPTQLALVCAQAGERIMNKNYEKALPTYTLPCQGGASTAILAGAK